jgi:co-chaperonin GroES (HSP10)
MITAPGWAIIEAQEKRKVGSIELPDAAKSETQTGTIVAWPESRTYIEGGAVADVPPFKVGDTVAYRKYHTSEMEVDGKKYQGVHLENIITKLS